jgi:hypothetical protein
VEEMIQGDMYSVDAYVGPTGNISCLPPIKVITSHSLGMPGFYAYRTIVPAPDLTADDVAAANATCISAIKALNLSSSTAHIELYKTTAGWKIIEVGPRMGGCREYLYRGSYGVEHYQNDLAIRLGSDVTIPTDIIGYASGMSIYADNEGIIEAIDGIEEVKSMDSIIYFSNKIPVGGMAHSSSNGGTSVIAAVVTGKDLAELDANFAKVRQLITIHTKPQPQSLQDAIEIENRELSAASR